MNLSYLQAYLSTFQCILNTMIKKMTSACLSQSISQQFIVQMIPHHEAAIQMSHNILIYSCDCRLIKIAENIITTQTKGIQEMKAILSSCSTCDNQECDLRQYRQQIDQIMCTMFDNMENAAVSQDIDADFMRQMIGHHQGAIAMSKTALSYPVCHALRHILESIIVSQEQGVREMCALLNHF